MYVSKVVEYRINIQKLNAFLYTSSEHMEKNALSFTVAEIKSNV